MSLRHIEPEHISHYCILLPQLTAQGLQNRVNDPIYCVIESKWMDAVPGVDTEPVFHIPKI